MTEKNKKFTIRNVISAIFTFMIISFLLSAVFNMYLSQTNYLEGNVAIIDIKGPIYIEAQQTLFSSVLPTTSELIVRELEKVQSNPNIKVVLGGPHATYLPAETLAHGCVDIVVSGEGEENDGRAFREADERGIAERC